MATTTFHRTTESKATPRLPLAALGLSLSLFLAISYVLCVLYGLAVGADGFHETLLPMVLPGFAWLTWPGFLLGLVWSVAFGWYIAIVFAPLFNVFASRLR